MKTFVPALFAISLFIVVGCSRQEADSTLQAADLPEEQVAEIVNAFNENDAAKAMSLLVSNPKLVDAVWTQGGPRSGWPLIMIAAYNGNVELVTELIKLGADVNESNYSSEVALHYAAYKAHPQVVELLLANGADVNVQNDVGTTPLAMAHEGGNQKIVEMLTAKGAQ